MFMQLTSDGYDYASSDLLLTLVLLSGILKCIKRKDRHTERLNCETESRGLATYD